jgi:serine/threonine-protein kinase
VSPDPSANETAPHGCDECPALVYAAQDSGDWKPVAMWLARHPECAEAFARIVDDDHWTRRRLPAAESLSDLPGTVLGGIELQERVGGGTYGEVYRGFDTGLKRDVAVKFVRNVDPEQLRVEAETVAGLAHENIVPVYAFGETDRGPHVVMPLMTGTLDEYRRARADGKVPAEEAARLVRDIARGVHHAHQRGLIHRDLKPLNVLLDGHGVPKVADFGLARRVGVTGSAVIAGTYAYMAPEQARGEKGLTTAVDVHALGATLFELLTGRLPFGGGPAALPHVIADPAPPVRDLAPEVSKDLEAVCRKCLEKLPQDRYATAQEVAEELDRCLRGEPVKARPPGFWDWLLQLARTRPEPHPRYSWQVTVWFGAIVLLANALVYFMVRTDAPAAGIWVVNLSFAFGFVTVLWWYMLRRFRQLPVTERHSLVNAVGHIAVYIPLLVAFVPLSLSTPARAGLGIYPPLAALSGIGFFILGSTNWSRFFPIGLLTMGLVPVMTRWPESSPLVYGIFTAAMMWYWSFAKKDGFGYRAADPQ